MCPRWEQQHDVFRMVMQIYPIVRAGPQDRVDLLYMPEIDHAWPLFLLPRKGISDSTPTFRLSAERKRIRERLHKLNQVLWHVRPFLWTRSVRHMVHAIVLIS